MPGSMFRPRGAGVTNMTISRQRFRRSTATVERVQFTGPAPTDDTRRPQGARSRTTSSQQQTTVGRRVDVKRRGGGTATSHLQHQQQYDHHRRGDPARSSPATKRQAMRSTAHGYDGTPQRRTDERAERAGTMTIGDSEHDGAGHRRSATASGSTSAATSDGNDLSATTHPRGAGSDAASKSDRPQRHRSARRHDRPTCCDHTSTITTTSFDATGRSYSVSTRRRVVGQFRTLGPRVADRNYTVRAATLRRQYRAHRRAALNQRSASTNAIRFDSDSAAGRQSATADDPGRSGRGDCNGDGQATHG